MEINQWQDQILLGTLLGSGFLIRSGKSRYYAGMSETRDKQWFTYKCRELDSIAAHTPICRSGGAFKWRSVSGEFWEDYWHRFYDDQDRQRIGMDTLDRLKDSALSVWFGDKGYWYTTRRIGLRTGKFGESNKIICNYFNEVGIGCEVRADSNNTIRCVFTREGTVRFIATCGHCLPEFMVHKLDARRDSLFRS